jgi:hypothetical protein
MPKPVTHTCPCSMAASNTCTAAIHLVLAALQRLLRQHLYFCTSKASKLQPNIRAVAVQKAERTVVRLEKLVAKCCHVGAHMPASRLPSSYVSIRQHTSAHVSIRQHTSAYLPSTTASPNELLLNVRLHQPQSSIKASYTSRLRPHTLVAF